MLVLDRIHQEAVERPQRLAVVHDGSAISYRQFHQLIMAARGSLAGEGLRAGSTAVVWVNDLMDSRLIDFALRSLGLTTLAVRTPQEIAALGGLDVSCIVTTQAMGALDPALIPAGAREIRVPADAFAAAPSLPVEPIVSHAPPGGHVLLTSGTTGRYKMILIEPETEDSVRQAGLDLYRSLGSSVVQEGADLIANILNFGLWTAAGYNAPLTLWANGHALVTSTALDHRSFLWPGVTHAIVTPAFLTRLLQTPPEQLPRMDGLQLITVGGALSMPLARQTKARLTSRIAITLGSTEAGGIAITPVESEEDLRWQRLHPEREVEVVDEDHAPLPPGKLGQVRVRLTNGRTGYLNDPEASAEFFRDGWFYPGDLGVLDGKGRLALFGRVTDVISILGDKYPAQPYEQALQDRLMADGVCVLSEPGAGGTEEIHVVVETRRAIGQDEVAAAARETFTSEFPQAHFHFVQQMPRNRMGKVNRFALKQMLLERRRA